jgi:hypothetical protein
MIKNTLYLVIIIILFSCKSTFQTQSFSEIDISIAPNYNDEKNWAVLPNSYSEDLKEFSSKEIDVKFHKVVPISTCLRYFQI